MSRSTLIIFVAAVAIGLAIAYWPRSTGSTVEIALPASFSQQAIAGRAAFEKNCKTCHGVNATGSSNGPPLIHIIYEPSHHSDQSFHRAVRNGVQAHHWQLGDMPALEYVQPKQVDSIIVYVRELQRANGIN
jgi:mono/diheme cytochrome c family protein